MPRQTKTSEWQAAPLKDAVFSGYKISALVQHTASQHIITKM